MENNRFDELTRMVAGFASRRSVLRGVATGGAASALGLTGLVSLSGLDDAEAKKKHKNKNKKKKCKKDKNCKKSSNPCEKAVCKGGKCKKKNQPDGTECGDGLVCDGGACVCPGGTCISTVTPSNLGPWQFYNDQADQPIAPTFVLGPEDPPLGDGSALLQIGGNSEGKLLSANILLGAPLANFEVLTYTYFVTSSAANTGPSLQLGVSKNPATDTEWQGRLVYVPSATENVPTEEWITEDVLADNGDGNWFFTRSAQSWDNACPLSNPCNLSEILAQFPDIGIHATGEEGTGAGFGFIGAKVGSGEGAVDANIDSIGYKLSTDDTTTIFNFEPDPS